jgi:hypothetical protein
MVEFLTHKVQYKIIFKSPVDYFDVVLQKQIELRKKLEINEDFVCVIDLSKDKRFYDSDYIKKYGKIFYNVYDFRFSFLVLNNSPDKYKYLKQIFYEIKKFISDYKNMSYEEFEHKIDLMLEEFKLFLDKFEFNEDEKKIIEAFTLDDKLKSNIKSLEWSDHV